MFILLFVIYSIFFRSSIPSFSFLLSAINSIECVLVIRKLVFWIFFLKCNFIFLFYCKLFPFHKDFDWLEIDSFKVCLRLAHMITKSSWTSLNNLKLGHIVYTLFLVQNIQIQCKLCKTQLYSVHNMLYICVGNINSLENISRLHVGLLLWIEIGKNGAYGDHISTKTRKDSLIFSHSVNLYWYWSTWLINYFATKGAAAA